MICGAGDASCCQSVTINVQRRLNVLEASLSELLERFENLISVLAEEDDQQEAESEVDEPENKICRLESDYEIN